jgi:hypothetical protein
MDRRSTHSHDLTVMRAVPITRFGGAEILEIVDVPEAAPGRSCSTPPRPASTSPTP